MWFNIGVVELGLVGVLFVFAGILGLFRSRFWRWPLVGAECAIAGAVFSPADPVSCVILAVVFLLFFAAGGRLAGGRAVASR
jgi:Sec-independent protein secretion pathway component TatC